MGVCHSVQGFTEPANITSWNRAHAGAYRKGVLARAAGMDLAQCPYEDRRKASGRISWSRSFITAWQDGWQDADRYINGLGGVDETDTGR